MDPRVNQVQETEWTSVEVEQARSLVASLSGVNGSGDLNKKHNDMVDELRAWFPRKTTRQVTDLYVDIVVEMHTRLEEEEEERESRLRHRHRPAAAASASSGNCYSSSSSSSGSGNGRGLVPAGAYCAMSDLVNDNFGVPEEAVAAAMDDGGAGNAGMVLGFAPQEMAYQLGMDQAVAGMGMGGGGFPSEYVKVQEEVPRRPVVDHRPVAARRTTGRFWTTEEHRQFLRGLLVYGRGSWKNISRHFVPTRTPVQVSSHAQKYFRRQELLSSGGGSSSGRQRYSINDVGLNDGDVAGPWAAAAAAAGENIFGTANREARTFAGGAVNNHHDLRAAPGVISPAPAAPLVTMDDYLAQLCRSPDMYSQLQVGGGGQPPAWSGQQTEAGPSGAADPVEGGAGNFVYDADQFDQWMNNNMQ